MKANQNFEMTAGNTKRLRITVYEDGQIKNLTGAQAKWVLWSDYANAVVVTKQTGAGIVIDAPTSGQLVIVLDPGDTELLEPGSYKHECQITDASGAVSTVLTGEVTIFQSRI